MKAKDMCELSACAAPGAKFQMVMIALAAATLVIALRENAQATDVNALSASNRAVLGAGYNSGQQRFLSSMCLTDGAQKSLRYVGTALGKVAFLTITDRERLQASFGMDVSARARFGLFKADAVAHFLQESLDESYSLSATLEYDIAAKDVLLQLVPDPEKILTEAAKGAAKKPAEFRRRCGDEYVSRIESGARLFITVRATFLNLQAKEDFASNVNLSQGFNSLSVQLKKLKQETREHGSVSIVALQMGGDPRQLASALGQGSGSSSTFPILNCSLTQTDACQAALKAAVDYAAGDGAKSFRGNVGNSYDPNKPDSGLADIAYHTASWTDLGINTTPSLPDQQRDLLISSLVSRFDIQRGNIRRIEDLLYPGRFRLCDKERDAIQALRVIVQANVSAIAKAADVCYNDEIPVTECDKITKNLDRLVTPISEKQLQPSICEPCGPQCSDCYLLDGKPTCLSCDRSVADFLSGDLILKYADMAKSFDELIRKNAVVSTVCTHMRPNVSMSISTSGTFGTGANDLNDGWGSWIQYRLVVPNQFDEISMPESFKGATSSIAISKAAQTDAQGNLTAAATYGHCQHFVDQTNAHQIFDCPIRFQSDFRIRIEDIELKKKLHR